MKRGKMIPMLVICGVTLVLLGQTTDAYAWHRKWKKHHSYHSQYNNHYNHNGHGNLYVSLPFGYITLRVGGLKYQYNNGDYYRRSRHGYVLVPAPIGACISHLPFGARTKYVNGKRYHHHNGIYYKHTHEGYVVVEEPVEYYAYEGKVKNKKHYDFEEISFTINIPNNHGGYSEVSLKRTKDGFIGPQGEFYSEFPKVAHLKVMYAK